MLRENARNHGVEVVTGARVQDVLFNGDRAMGGRVKLSDGDLSVYNARVIVDATGLSALISRRLNIAKSDRDLKKASIFTHFENGRRG